MGFQAKCIVRKKLSNALYRRGVLSYIDTVFYLKE